jgi:transposase
MPQPFDLRQFPDLPPAVVKAFAAQQSALEAARFEASVERAARQHEQAVVAEKEAFITELKELIEKLEGQVGQYRQAKFGPKSEKLDPAQLELALEDLETAIAETQAQIAAVEDKIAASATDPDKVAPRALRKARALPEHLPRVECVIEPTSVACPCGCGDMVRIGEDRTERLDPPRANSPPDCLLILVDPGALSGDRHGPSEICLPQGADGGGAGQSSGTSP